MKCDDFLQNYELTVAVNQYVPVEKDDPPYKVVANPEELKAKEEKNGKYILCKECLVTLWNVFECKLTSIQIGKENGALPASDEAESDEDDLMVVETTEDPQEGSSSKRRKLNDNDSDDDIIEIPL